MRRKEEGMEERERASKNRTKRVKNGKCKEKERKEKVLTAMGGLLPFLRCIALLCEKALTFALSSFLFLSSPFFLSLILSTLLQIFVSSSEQPSIDDVSCFCSPPYHPSLCFHFLPLLPFLPFWSSPLPDPSRPFPVSRSVTATGIKHNNSGLLLSLSYFTPPFFFLATLSLHLSISFSPSPFFPPSPFLFSPSPSDQPVNQLHMLASLRARSLQRGIGFIFSSVCSTGEFSMLQIIFFSLSLFIASSSSSSSSSPSFFPLISSRLHLLLLLFPLVTSLFPFPLLSHLDLPLIS